MEEKLEELGLTRNEAKIYLFLLKRGEQTTGPIIKETRIANSRVYESLSSLISKGFVTFNIQKKGKYFQAVEPKKFLELEEERKKKIHALIPELASLRAEEESETKVAIYEGFEGFKTAFNKIMDDCPKGGNVYAIGFSRQTFAHESLNIFLDNINLKAEEKKITFKILMDSAGRDSWKAESLRKRSLDVRYMPPGFISPAATDVFEDYVYMFLWEEKPFVFMIRNKRIAEGFKQYHSFLWQMGKK